MLLEFRAFVNLILELETNVVRRICKSSQLYKFVIKGFVNLLLMQGIFNIPYDGIDVNEFLIHGNFFQVHVLHEFVVLPIDVFEFFLVVDFVFFNLQNRQLVDKFTETYLHRCHIFNLVESFRLCRLLGGGK